MTGRQRLAGTVLCGAGIAVATVSVCATGELARGTVAILTGLVIATGGLLLTLLSPMPGSASEKTSSSDGRHALSEAARAELDAERAALKQLQNELDRELKQRAQQLDERESQLARRLIAFQEWLEYPQPDESQGTTQDTRSAAEPFAGPELEIRDRRVIELLDAEAKFVYERIRDGRYREGGQLRIDPIREDTLDLIQRVARIYRPDCDNPLLETSVEKLLRAGSRVCLHLLVVLERLPLDLHQENLSTLHEYVRRAVKACDVYTAAEPYLGYASKALYAGRLAMGTNPLTLGITWALGELGRRGIKAVGQKFVDQQAVALLSDLVRVIGFEVAGIYGGDFRHRDPNWVYGAELTDLMSRFPVSRQNLAHALREIGSLTFRNEYDRVFLYRCLSTHRSAGPPSSPHEFLPPDVRQEIARKLESFFRNFVHGRTERDVATWQSGVETRLGLRLRVTADTTDQPDQTGVASHDATAAVTSLAAFVTAVKGRDLKELSPETLAPDTAAIAGRDTVATVLRNHAGQPPQFFEGVDIDPGSRLVDSYLSDLIRLTVRLPPFDVQPDDLVLETALWFGRDAATIRRQLDTEYAALVRDLLPEDAPTRKLSPAVSRTLLAELLPEETLQFAYPEVRLSAPASEKTPVLHPSPLPGKTPPENSPSGNTLAGHLPRDGKLWLVGTDQRLLLIAETIPQVLATSHLSGLSVAKGDGLVVSECNLSGGRWTCAGDESHCPLELTIAGSMLTRFDTWFRPLLETVRQAAR